MVQYSDNNLKLTATQKSSSVYSIFYLFYLLSGLRVCYLKYTVV